MLQTIPTFNTQQYVSVLTYTITAPLALSADVSCTLLTYTLTAQLALSADVRCTSPSINI
jgi:hypothetical protein